MIGLLELNMGHPSIHTTVNSRGMSNVPFHVFECSVMGVQNHNLAAARITVRRNEKRIGGSDDFTQSSFHSLELNSVIVLSTCCESGKKA